MFFLKFVGCVYLQFGKIDCGWKYSDIERLQDRQESSPAARELPSVGGDIARFQETGSTGRTWLLLSGANPAEEHRQYDSSSGGAAAELRAHAGQLLPGFPSFCRNRRRAQDTFHFTALLYSSYRDQGPVGARRTSTTTRHTEKRIRATR